MCLFNSELILTSDGTSLSKTVILDIVISFVLKDRLLPVWMWKPRRNEVGKTGYTQRGLAGEGQTKKSIRTIVDEQEEEIKKNDAV